MRVFIESDGRKEGEKSKRVRGCFGGGKRSLRTIVEEGGEVVGVLFEEVDVEGRGMTAGLLEAVVKVLRSGGGAKVDVATAELSDISKID